MNFFNRALRTMRTMLATALCGALLLASAPQQRLWAQNAVGAQVGAHVGVLAPLVTFSQFGTSTIGDDFVIGFPMGISIKPGGDFWYDLEIVPFVDYPRIPGRTQSTIATSLLLHPGLLYNAGAVALGLRGAIELGPVIGSSSVGFTPLVNKSFPLTSKSTVFVELMVPVRFVKTPLGEDRTLTAIALHVGVGL